jgi:hypothetical protein
MRKCGAEFLRQPPIYFVYEAENFSNKLAHGQNEMLVICFCNIPERLFKGTVSRDFRYFYCFIVQYSSYTPNPHTAAHCLIIFVSLTTSLAMKLVTGFVMSIVHTLWKKGTQEIFLQNLFIYYYWKFQELAIYHEIVRTISANGFRWKMKYYELFLKILLTFEIIYE